MARASQPVRAAEALHASDAEAYEQQNVHAVYDDIAEHFSCTRFKPWPLIPKFLDTLPAGSVGADVGCGNGKYLYLRSALGDRCDGAALLTLGADRCEPLVRDAQKNFSPGSDARRLHEVAVDDALNSGYRSGVFDYALSIATIHHFSTAQRRMQAVKELLRIVRPAPHAAGDNSAETRGEELAPGGIGRILIFVWALEQRGGGRRQFDTQLAEQYGADAVDDDAQLQDVLVPWVSRRQETDSVRHRYYHLFRAGELDELVTQAANALQATCPSICVRKEAGGWEKGNWWGVWQVSLPPTANAHKAAAAA